MESIRNTQNNFKVLILVFLLLAGFQSFAALNSPFSSTVSGLSIPNAHIVSQTSGLVIRGQEPKLNEISQLKNLGVKRILIFKNDTQGDIEREISNLQMNGFQSNKILNIPMPWKNIQNFNQACQMTVTALRFLEASVQAHESIYFHCTVGEDRTGYLAGLWTLWNGEYSDVMQVFQKEMCAKGFEGGDPEKPEQVVNQVRANLNPLFVKMVEVLRQARQNSQSLDQIGCPSDVQITHPVPTCH